MEGNFSNNQLKDLMLNHDFYPDLPPYIEFQETRTSLLFFTNSYVYKIKRAGHFRSFDFSTLENRKRYCYDEIKAHRKMHENVVIKVVPILYNSDTKHLFVGKNADLLQKKSDWRIVEYAIQMHRISEEAYEIYQENQKKKR